MKKLMATIFLGAALFVVFYLKNNTPAQDSAPALRTPAMKQKTPEISSEKKTQIASDTRSEVQTGALLLAELQGETYTAEKLINGIPTLKQMGKSGFEFIAQEIERCPREDVLKRQSLFHVLNDVISDKVFLDQVSEDQKKVIYAEAERLAREELRSEDYIEIQGSAEFTDEQKHGMSHLGVVSFHGSKAFHNTTMAKMAAISLYSSIPGVSQEAVRSAAHSAINPLLSEYVNHIYGNQ